MNGFKLMSEALRNAAERGEISKEKVEKKCKVYDFLATCDQEDFYELFDSSAFNEISKSYMRLAVKRLVENGTLEEDQGRAVRNEFAFLFDEKKSKEVWEEDEI